MTMMIRSATSYVKNPNPPYSPPLSSLVRPLPNLFHSLAHAELQSHQTPSAPPKPPPIPPFTPASNSSDAILLTATLHRPSSSQKHAQEYACPLFSFYGPKSRSPFLSFKLPCEGTACTLQVKRGFSWLADVSCVRHFCCCC